MKQTFRKSLSLILALALIVALPMQALGAPIRETDYFPEKSHTDRPYSDIVFTQPDLEGAQAIIEAIEPLLDDPGNIGYVGRLFEELDGVLGHGMTMSALSSLNMRKDPADQEAAEQYLTANERLSRMIADINQLIARMDGSPCREVLLDFMTEETIDSTADEAAAADPKEQELQQEAAKQRSRYMSLAAQEPSEERSREIGGLYLEMVDTNNRLARLKGYDDYQDYAYHFYDRDYTPEDVARLREDIKKYVAPYCTVYSIINALVMRQESGISEVDAVSPQVQEKIKEFLGSLSSELLESYDFMWDKGYYDFEETGPGDQNAFVQYLYGLDVPFMRINHAGFRSDNENALWKLQTFIHEFGHYNANYQLPQNLWDNSGAATDVQETHSTGLEALFASRAGEIVGEENADIFLEGYIYNNTVALFLSQAPLDELEEYAYTTPGVTADDLDRKYIQLMEEYGYPKGAYDSDEWMEISQLFDSPFYVASYTTAGLATMRLWLDSLEDYEGTVDKYLAFVSQGMDISLCEGPEKAGMADPFQEGALKELMDSVNEEFGLEERMTETIGHPFMDAVTASWYRDAVKYVYQQGIMVGTGDMKFSPNEAFDRGMLVTTLWRQAGSPGMEDENWGYPYKDVDMDAYYGTAVYWARLEGIASGCGGSSFCPDDPVTRQDFVSMLWRQAGRPRADISVLNGFRDGGQVSGYAREAMAWAVENHIIAGNGSGVLAPKDGTTRAQAAQIFMKADDGRPEPAALDDAA